jgi:hypothetical protein
VAEIFAYEHDMPLYHITCNRVSADTISTDEVQPGGSSPFLLTGTNVPLAMWDGGHARTTHQEFAVARVRNVDAADIVDHPTMVAGTMAAKGVEADAKGMASEASVDVYYWDDLISDLSGCVAGNDRIRISNHSYSIVCGWDQGIRFYLVCTWFGDTRLSNDEDYKFGFYSTDASAMDAFCYQAPYHLPVYSAGNNRGTTHDGWLYPIHGIFNYDSGQWQNSWTERPPDGNTNGYDCVSPRGVPKNIMTVGAVQDLVGGFTNGAPVILEYYSDTGPTDDGRVKPDIVANGNGLYTTTSATNNMGYASPSGTSFSSPSVAGSMALLQEFHERIYGTNPPMLASTMKALVLHTADDLETQGPDYRTGWGLMNTLAAAWVITNNAAWDSLPHIKEVSLADGQYVEFDALASTNEPLKVTICWTDPAGPVHQWALDPTNLVLVNDLDLRVISPDGSETNTPWVLNPQNPTNAATTGDNFRDNVEQVVITDPTNGWYSIQVTHKGTLSNGVQDVSIIVTGNTPTNAPDFVITDIGVEGTNGLINLQWPGVVGALYEINTSTNLLVQDGWTNQNDAVSANLEQMQWTDEDAASDEVRFYRLKRLR